MIIIIVEEEKNACNATIYEYVFLSAREIDRVILYDVGRISPQFISSYGA